MVRRTRLKAPKTLDEVEAQAALLSHELEALEALERDRIGRLACAAGLSDLALSDVELRAGLRHLAARFGAGRKPSRRRRLRQRQLLLERKRRMLQGAERRAARRADTAHKFQLGGLIALAGLRHEPAPVLLGGLLELRKRIEDRQEAATLRGLGDREFARRRLQ